MTITNTRATQNFILKENKKNYKLHGMIIIIIIIIIIIMMMMMMMMMIIIIKSKLNRLIKKTINKYINHTEEE